MKNNFLLVIAGIAIIGAIMSCSESHKKEPLLSGTIAKPDSIDRISFVTATEADKWVKYYHGVWKKLLPKDSLPIKFFTVKTQDVLLAMGINQPWNTITTQQYIRVNLGYDSASNQMKCFIQPVENVDFTKNYAGEGMFFNKNGQIVSKKGKSLGLGSGVVSDSTYVADLNTPCPNTCGN